MPGQFFVFLVEMGFHCVSLDGLDLLTSDSPALASQSVGITGVNHHVWSQGSFRHRINIMRFSSPQVIIKDQCNGSKAGGKEQVVGIW